MRIRAIPPDTCDEAPSLQRTSGRGELAVRVLDGRTRLARLFQEGAARIRMPKVHAGRHLEAVLINTAGGLTGGDRLDWRIDVLQGGGAVVTTQACEKIYRSPGGTACVATAIDVGRDAALSWLPQETILFDRSALDRRLEVDLAPGAAALVVEPVVLGRQAMGEKLRTARFRERWRIRRGGRLIHAEDFVLAGDVQALIARSAVARGRIAFATLLFIHDDAAELVDRARSVLGGDGGASAWSVAGDNKLVARILADSGYALRNRLVPLIGLCHNMLVGTAEHTMPKVWNC